VRYGICDSLLIGHGRIDVVRDHCVGPTELLPGNPNPKLRKIPGSLVRHCAYILRTPQHNIALENGETVDIGVEKTFASECYSCNERCTCHWSRAEFSFPRILR
jgi:hypothetical protein